MRTVFEQKVGRADVALGSSSRIMGLTRVLGGILFFALRHSPIQVLGAWSRLDVWNVTRRAVIAGVLLSGLAVATPSFVFGAQSVTFAWNPVTNANLAGYNIYYGSVSHSYTNVISVGNVTNATISGLVAGGTYYFAATTLSTSGLESGLSDEVSYTVPNTVPMIQVTPGSMAYGRVLVGTSATNSFTVQNVGSGTLSGTASVGAPFSVVSGGSYSLGAGQTQAVMVAFSPVVASNYSQSVTLTGGGGTNATVSGSVSTALADVQLQVTPAKQFILTVAGQTGHTYDIQATQDFKTWTVIGTVTMGVSGSLDFTDTNAANFSNRFYRIRE